MMFRALPPWITPTFQVVKGGVNTGSVSFASSAPIASISGQSRPAAWIAEAPTSGYALCPSIPVSATSTAQ
jgi:hypothetical protein